MRMRMAHLHMCFTFCWPTFLRLTFLCVIFTVYHTFFVSRFLCLILFVYITFFLSHFFCISLSLCHIFCESHFLCISLSLCHIFSVSHLEIYWSYNFNVLLRSQPKIKRQLYIPLLFKCGIHNRLIFQLNSYDEDIVWDPVKAICLIMGST